TPDRSEEFISLVVVVFDTEAGTLRFASAGHPAAWLWHDKEVRPLRATGPLLMLDPRGSYHSREIDLDPGDLLLMYTDGLAEVRNGDQMFGQERIANALRRDPQQSPDVLCKKLLESARDFPSETSTADVAILATRRTSRARPRGRRRRDRPARRPPAPPAPPHQRRAAPPDPAGAGRQPGQGGREAGRPEQALRPRPAGPAAGRRFVRRARPAGQQPGRRPAGRRRGHRGRADRGPAGVRRGQRPDGEG